MQFFWFPTEVRYGSDAVQANRKSWPDYREPGKDVVWYSNFFFFILDCANVRSVMLDWDWEKEKGWNSTCLTSTWKCWCKLRHGFKSSRSHPDSLTSLPKHRRYRLAVCHTDSDTASRSDSALPDCSSREPASIIGTNCLTSKRHLHWILFHTCGKIFGVFSNLGSISVAFSPAMIDTFKNIWIYEPGLIDSGLVRKSRFRIWFRSND